MNPKRSNLLKLEATALFTCLKARINDSRWSFFVHARETAYPLNVLQTISPYRASLHFAYGFSGRQHNPKTGQEGEIISLTTDVYLEREVQANYWNLSFTGLEGKTEALLLADALKPLADQGFYIPNGNENLERQMNFSLGLYGDCLMHVDIRLPEGKMPLESVSVVLDHLESLSLMNVTTLRQLQEKQTDLNDDDETEDGLVIMGDWQTWK